MKYFRINLLFTFLLLFISSTLMRGQSDNIIKNSNDSFLKKFRASLNNSGIDFEFGYKGEIFSNISGGIENKTVYLDNFDFVFNFNLEKIAGWKGAQLTTYFLGNNGDVPSEYAGAIQGISNIAAHNTWKLYEFKLEQILFEGRLTLLAGLYDLNSEFDTREFSGVFINPSHGIGPDFALTGNNGPSIFPTTSLAFRASYNFTKLWNLKAAVFDGIPGDLNNANGTRIVLDSEDGLLITSELTHTNGNDEVDHSYFKYSFGGWYYTGQFESLSEFDSFGNAVMQKGNYGFYGSAEKFLLHEDNTSNEGLGAFIRLGWSNNEINPVNSYIGAGINYIGLFPGREEDQLGFSVAAAHNNKKQEILFEQEGREYKEYEYILELTYFMVINEFIQIQPDIQYVINPSADIINNNSLVFGTRLHIIL